MINNLKKFNYEKIYTSEKLLAASNYFSLILNGIYNLLKKSFTNREEAKKICPELINDFEKFLTDYWNRERKPENKNEIIFNVTDEKDYYRAIIYYISGMTDNYAIDMYNKIIGF